MEAHVEEMDTSETIETEVISTNNMLTLITTEDGIPSSTEVTVLTTALGEVPIMTATLGTLSEMQHGSSGHPTFVTSNAGVRTVYTTSLVPSHGGQAVVLSDGQIAVMGPDGVQRTLVVTTDPTQLASTFSENDGSPQNIVTVNIEDVTNSDLAQGTTVVLTEADANSLTQEEQVVASVEEVSGEVVVTEISSAENESSVIIESREIEDETVTAPTTPVNIVPSERLVQHVQVIKSPISLEKIEDKPGKDTNTDVKSMEVDDKRESCTNEAESGPAGETQKDLVPSEFSPPILAELVCLVCYQIFPNPKCNKKEKAAASNSSLGQPVEDSESYGRTLGSFFETSRINMSIVTRRSYKDYKVPICHACCKKLDEADTILEKLKQLEKKLYYLRQEIKEKIETSHFYFKNKDNTELMEYRRKIVGFTDLLNTIDHIREDVINDGRPPKIPRSLTGKKTGRKPKKTEADVASKNSTQELDTASKNEGVDQTAVAGDSESNTETTGPVSASSSQSTEVIQSSTEVISSTQTSEANKDSTEPSTSILPNDPEEEKDAKPAVRTSFGRIVRRPAYMQNELTDDELSDLGESSEDNYEEIEVKPAILEEGEPGVVNEEDEEDPAWSPGRGTFISEKIGIAPSSSEESEYFSDASDFEAVKPKIKKESRVKKSRKPRTKLGTKKQKLKRQKPENINYEVKVIQIDGTELMTINTTGDADGIGLEPDITQKVMDSQAVIMVKNQLFGKRVHCSHCPRTFTDPARRDVHVKKKHEGVTKPFECEVCRKRFGRQDHLRNHMKRHTRPAKEKASSSKPKSVTSSEKTQCCEFCEQRFRNKSELIIHIRTHTGEKPFKCDCGEAFVSALKKEFHIEQMHPEVPPLRCEHCPKAFFRQHRLRIHAVSHTGEKTCVCEICGKCFSQAAMLRYHQTTHEELNLKQFKCQECSRVFANPQNLKSHMESQHEKMYRHRCDTCGRGYTQRSHLRRHLRTHSGEQPYVCSYCPKKFTSGAALKIHVRIHTGERPYWCSQCEKGFRSKTKLGRHLKTLIHSGEKDKIKKEGTLTTEIETVDVNAAQTTTWTEIVGIITGV